MIAPFDASARLTDWSCFLDSISAGDVPRPCVTGPDIRENYFRALFWIAFMAPSLEAFKKAEYRRRVHEAENWVSKEKMATKDGRQIKSDEQLHKEAAEKFGLDSSWGAIDNPNYHGARVSPAPPKGKSVSFNELRQKSNDGTEVIESRSATAHEQAWRDLGHQDPVPPAFMVDGRIFVDMSKWPQGLPRDWTPRRGGS
jgi:hypothetical protein